MRISCMRIAEYHLRVSVSEERAHELFSGALAAKAASFDGSSDSLFRELLELVVLQPVESHRKSASFSAPNTTSSSLAPALGSLPTYSVIARASREY